MSTSTKYTVTRIEKDGTESEAGSKSKKSTAVDLARSVRATEKVGVRVTTGAGKVVFDMPAPKKIKMSPQYTRVVPLPEGVVVPDGKRVAYFRPRRNGAILHDPTAEVGKQYTILDVKTGEELDEVFPTTRAAGARLKLGV